MAASLWHIAQALAWLGNRVDPRVPGPRPSVAAWCRRLAEAPGAATLDHDDLHGWNILGGPGRSRFYDRGDSVVGHPFASLLVPLENADPQDRPRLRDAFLDVYSDLGSHIELVEVADLACRLGQVARTLANKQAMGDPDDGRWGEASWTYLNGLLTPVLPTRT